MILQALVAYYNALAFKGEIAREGWGPAKISFALVLNKGGELIEVLDLREEKQRGKKMVPVPREYPLPKIGTRTVGIKPIFLWDNSKYILGMDEKESTDRTRKCFEACKKLHLDLLEDVEDDAARAVCSFFKNWDPDQGKDHPALVGDLPEILSGNFIFRVGGRMLHEVEAVARVWENAPSSLEEQTVEGRCLVTGAQGPVARLHPMIKGVAGAQSSGASLVSFNAEAFESYEKKQSYNAPVGPSASFAYAAALNHLLSDRQRVQQMGDVTVVCWSETGESAYQDSFLLTMEPTDGFDDNELMRAMSELAKGRPYQWDETDLDPETSFYILGLSPNAARLSVRFFYQNEFGHFMRNIQEHYNRLTMVKPSYHPFERLSIRNLLDETVNKNSREKKASSVLSGSLYRAVINDTPYPEALISGVLLRIRAEHIITWGRASIIKAYWLKKDPNCKHKEVFSVKLNDDCSYQPYILGRLFSVLEDLQLRANPGINATIRDKYFNSAAATPASIFPLITRLASTHLRKLGVGNKIFYEKQIGKLSSKIIETLPASQSLPDQEVFYLGYYHQTQKRYEKKSEED